MSEHIPQFVSFRGRFMAEEYHGHNPRVLVTLAGKSNSEIIGIEIDLFNGNNPMTAKATKSTRRAVIAAMLESEEFKQLQIAPVPMFMDDVA